VTPLVQAGYNDYADVFLFPWLFLVSIFLKTCPPISISGTCLPAKAGLRNLRESAVQTIAAFD